MNDTRITDYALGELHGPAREAFEKELATSEDLQKDLAEAVALCQSLTDLPRSEDTLTDDQRASLRDECLKNIRIVRRHGITRRTIAGGSLAALAAGLVFMSVSPWFVAPSRPQENEIVLLSRPADQAEVDQLLSEAQESIAMGRNDKALKSFREVLNKDGYNLAAREGVEKLGMVNAAPEAAKLVADKRLAIVDQALKSLPPASNDHMKSDGDVDVAALLAVAPSTVTGSGAYLSGLDTSASQMAAPVASVSQPVMNRVAQIEPIAGSADYTDGQRRRYVGESKANRRFVSAWTDGDTLSRSNVEHNTEAYDPIQENVFLEAKTNPLSTFSIDVDTASYSNIRRMLTGEQLPPHGAVRIEELLNYFTYQYPQPKSDVPFSVNVETSQAPWAPNHELVRIGLKGREIPSDDRSPANLVFLIDVSGSMNSDAKLPLLKRSLQAMVKNLAPEDRVAIVVYAGSSGLVLPSTPGKDRERILSALENLSAGGSTNGAEGIKLAYQQARENFLKAGNNRVILCTDGDFNVGVTNQSDLVDLIERERASGVFLSVLGFGTGNLKDSTMEKLADKGNGNYAYIDSFSEGRKVLIEQMNSTLFVIAKDVKIQVEFNPARVAGYRLIGYENRLLAKEDFNDDKKDAGEIGAGHTVTALYEIVPAGQPLPDRPSVDPLKYQATAVEPRAESLLETKNGSHLSAPPSTELATVKLRYKAPDGDKSELISVPIADGSNIVFDKASPDFQFAAAVAAFGMKLRQSSSVADYPWANIQSIARRNLGEDPGSYRAEFLTLVEKAARLRGEAPKK